MTQALGVPWRGARALNRELWGGDGVTVTHRPGTTRALLTV